MWNLFTNFLHRENLLDTTNQQDYVLEQTNLEETKSRPRYNNPEIQRIADEYGGLLYAGRYEIKLQHLLEMVPRKRKKADAYKGLRSELKRYGVDLVVTSNKPNKTILNYEEI